MGAGTFSAPGGAVAISSQQNKVDIAMNEFHAARGAYGGGFVVAAVCRAVPIQLIVEMR